MISRFTVFAVVISIVYLAVLFRLYDIQIIHGDYYVARAESQSAADAILKIERGAIYFRDKNNSVIAVAANKYFPLIYAVPKTIEDPLEVSNRLAPLLGTSQEGLRAQLLKSSAYELLVKKADRGLAQKIEDLKIKGVFTGLVPERFYPLGTIGAHLIGFAGPNAGDLGESGHYGLERFYEQVFTGKKRGQGVNVILAVDPAIQIEAERVLERTIKAHRAKGGSVIVQDPKTGRILAMGSYPNFDPNRYQEFDLSVFLNPVTEQIYEPGSVFKVFTMAAGIDAGTITPETRFYDSGSVTLNGKKIQNWDSKAHGWVTMTNVLEESLNTGAAFAERETGHKIFKSYLSKFGFEEKTGIDLPGEVKGDLRQLHPRAPAILFATASFGQGVAVTPIELINAVSAIANGGNLMRPSLYAEREPHVIRTVIQSSTARQVTAMMVSAVDKAKVAQVSGYSLAGKTGTAQVPDLTRGGYTDRVVHTYAGFGPASDPRFAILIKLNEPEGAPLAGTTVVPAFRDLAEFILNYYNVPPDRIQTK